MPLTLNDDQVRRIEAELAAGHRARRTEDLILPILNNPNLSARAKALLKEQYPNLDLGEYDVEVRGQAEIKKLRDELDAEKKAQKERQEDEYWAKQKQSTREKHQLTDEGMDKLEAFMKERNIGNYEDAADLMVARNPKPMEATQHQRFWRHDRQDEFKKIVDDPEDYAFNELVKAVETDDRSRRMR